MQIKHFCDITMQVFFTSILCAADSFMSLCRALGPPQHHIRIMGIKKAPTVTSSQSAVTVWPPGACRGVTGSHSGWPERGQLTHRWLCSAIGSKQNMQSHREMLMRHQCRKQIISGMVCYNTESISKCQQNEKKLFIFPNKNPTKTHICSIYHEHTFMIHQTQCYILRHAAPNTY